MPVSGNPFGVLKRAMQKTLKDKLEVHKAMAAAVKELLSDQFLHGVDPFGKAQPSAKGKFSGLQSSKLQRAIRVTPDASGVIGVGELKSSGVRKGKKPPPPRPRRQWLMAHQKGHIFPARSVEGQRRFFDGKGKRVHASRFKALVTGRTTTKTKKSFFGLKSTTTTRTTKGASRRVAIGAREDYWQEGKNRSRRLGTIRNVRTHSIRQRELVPRLIYPEPKLGARWGGRIKTFVGQVLHKQVSRNVERG